jgi:uncharacterized protein (TIGR00369 family)
MSNHEETLTPIPQAPSNRCFACGPDNPEGLHLEFFFTENKSVVSTPRISPTHDGHPGYLHGGIIATLLDETMAKSVRVLGRPTMTRHMEIDFLRPVPSSVQLRLEGRITRNEGRKHWSEARILNAHGTVLAQGKGLFVEITTARAAVRTAEEPPGRP